MLRSGTLLARRYRVREPLGQGALASTWMVRDEAFGREQALKLLGPGQATARAAFRAEFRLLAGLWHPHLVRVHDFGVARELGGPRFYFTSEVVRGAPLDRFAVGRRFHEVRQAIVDVLDALAFLHRRGIRHGDVKPDNVLVEASGRAVLLDLSCAARVDAEPSELISGTPGYLAPELLRGRPADGRADLWALGGTIRALSSRMAEPLPAEVVALCERLLRDDPAERPADAAEVLEWLGAAPRALPMPPEPARLVGRDEELAQVQAALAGLERGEAGPRLLVIAGEAGVGRSRLLREAKWCAELRLPTVEGFARGEAPVASMLARASGDDALPPGALGALRARQRLLSAAEPVVLVLDDADELAGGEREALEALARVLEPTDPVLLVVTERLEQRDAQAPLVATAAAAGRASIELRLGPLDLPAIRSWLASLGLEEAAPIVARASGGFAGDVASMAARIARTRDPRSAELPDVGVGARSRWEARLRGLVGERRAALALLAVLGGAASDAELTELGVSEDAARELAAAGLVLRSEPGWRLARAGPVAALLEALGEAAVRAAHADVGLRMVARLARLGAASDVARAGLAARAARHLAGAGDLAQAEGIFMAHASTRDADPRAWNAAAEALLEAMRVPGGSRLAAETRLEIALALERGGRAALAKEVLLPLLSDPALGAARPRVLARLGACEIELGDPAGALARYEEAAGATSSAPERAALADLSSRALLRLGAYAEARERAEPALAWTTDPAVLADLHEDVGIAASYLGERQLARAHLSAATELHRDRRAPRRFVRMLSYQAIDAWRAGDLEAALAGYRQALAAAEEHGLSDLVARCSLNVGTACHQRGELGEALAAYERGARLAAALGQADLLIVLDFNLAKLWADAGATDRAARAARRIEADAERTGARFFAAAAASVLGDCALARGDVDEATRCFERARAGFEGQGAQREVAEEELELARAALARGSPTLARDALTRARAHASALEAADLGARASVLDARLALLAGDTAAARAAAEAAVSLAERAGQQDLAAEACLARADIAGAAGEASLAEALRDRARVTWAAMARSLPEPMREPFWLHPRRAALRPDPRGAPAPAPAGGARVSQLERLLAIFRKLNSSLETSDILAMAMDAALDLITAERGFLLLEQPGGELRVMVARNVDREEIGKNHLKFSRSIAERAIETQEPVLTIDAQQDERFRAHASVHAMRLRSVLAVPIRSPGGVLGALYLDNRVSRARFERSDVDLLLAFADQVALALRNAGLVEDLHRRTEELEAERRRVEALMRGQAAEIGRLEEEVRRKQEALEHRYDYGAIIGRSPALRRVFATLDRVIDTPLHVLVTGESGTGKELVARAVHFAGARRAGPFVGVNCAALPPALLESELFGHVRGAFTGADQDRLGLAAAARGGTLFLDELGEMPLEVQAKLLRVLQEREVRPLGSTRSIPVDFRLVCATNRDLRTEVARGRFREDLFYRVSVVEIALPPLRDRPEDLPELALHFVRRAAESLGRPAPRLSGAALRKLSEHGWPGNVRELENVVTKAVVLCDGASIGPEEIDLPRGGRRGRRAPEVDERGGLLEALDRTGWNAVRAAAELGMPRATFYRKLKRFGIERPR